MTCWQDTLCLQGDLERTMGLPSSFLMDKSKAGVVCSQVNDGMIWFVHSCVPDRDLFPHPCICSWSQAQLYCSFCQSRHDWAFPLLRFSACESRKDCTFLALRQDTTVFLLKFCINFALHLFWTGETLQGTPVSFFFLNRVRLCLSSCHEMPASNVFFCFWKQVWLRFSLSLKISRLDCLFIFWREVSFIFWREVSNQLCASFYLFIPKRLNSILCSLFIPRLHSVPSFWHIGSILCSLFVSKLHSTRSLSWLDWSVLQYFDLGSICIVFFPWETILC